MKLDSIYVAVTDRGRSERFYADLFGTEACIRNDTFTFFNVGGVLFGLFDPASVDEGVTMGTNCVPNFRVDDVDALHNRLRNASTDCDEFVRTVGLYRLFQFRDPDGNLLEVYMETTEG